MFTGVIEDHVGSRKALVEDLLQRIFKYQDKGIREGQDKRLRRLSGELDAMQQKATAIRRDANLSEQGMAVKIRQLAKDQLTEFSWLFDDADGADKHYVSALSELNKMPESAAGRSELATLLRDKEIRSCARSLELPALMLRYRNAVLAGDTEFVRAIRTAPGGELLPADFIERVERERLELTQQDKLVLLDSLDLLRKELRGLAEMLRGWLSGYEEVKFPATSIRQEDSRQAAG